MWFSAKDIHTENLDYVKKNSASEAERLIEDYLEDYFKLTGETECRIDKTSLLAAVPVLRKHRTSLKTVVANMGATAYKPNWQASL